MTTRTSIATWSLLAGVAGLMAALMVPAAVAQSAVLGRSDVQVIARFEDARSLAVDPAGRLYVVDAGRNTVVQLDPSGGLLNTLGGPGADEGQFNEPTDIDPTNGLVWVVADAGNHRLQRFSRSSLFLEAVPVTRVDRFSSGAVAYARTLNAEGLAQEADGRPIAVVTSPADEVFAIDEMQGAVLKWDASRRFERIIGGFDGGEGTLQEPVALATDRRSLFVADRELAAVVVYDLFGGYVRTLARGQAQDVQRLTVANDELWIVLPRRLLVYQVRGTLQQVVDVDLDEPLVDVARVGRTTFLLTQTQLLRTGG